MVVEASAKANTSNIYFIINANFFHLHLPLHLPHVCPSVCSTRWTATPNSCDNARCCSLTGSTRRGCEGCDGCAGWEGCEGCAEGAAARRSWCFTARGGYLAKRAWSKYPTSSLGVKRVTTCHQLERSSQKIQDWCLMTLRPFKSHGLSSSMWLALLWLSSWPSSNNWSSKKVVVRDELQTNQKPPLWGRSGRDEIC